MPQSFDNCQKRGGKIRTKDLGNGKYIHICYKGGKSFAGYVKTKQNASRNKETSS